MVNVNRFLHKIMQIAPEWLYSEPSNRVKSFGCAELITARFHSRREFSGLLTRRRRIVFRGEARSHAPTGTFRPRFLCSRGESAHGGWFGWCNGSDECNVPSGTSANSQSFRVCVRTYFVISSGMNPCENQAPVGRPRLAQRGSARKVGKKIQVPEGRPSSRTVSSVLGKIRNTPSLDRDG
jgi:hypothetical protein